jgi:hypothetical protein
VTDLYTGAVTGAKFINIEMPIFRTDATFVLSLALRPEYLSQVIETKSVGPSWVVGVIDKNNRLIALARSGAICRAAGVGRFHRQHARRRGFVPGHDPGRGRC